MLASNCYARLNRLLQGSEVSSFILQLEHKPQSDWVKQVSFQVLSLHKSSLPSGILCGSGIPMARLLLMALLL
jgi:hypothetical protein